MARGHVDYKDQGFVRTQARVSGPGKAAPADPNRPPKASGASAPALVKATL